MCRYADDFVCAFECPEDAERFHEAVKERLAKFGLETAPEKTKVIQFGGKDTTGGEPFDFLGFEFRWEETRRGKHYIRRRTSRKPGSVRGLAGNGQSYRDYLNIFKKGG